MPPGMGYGRRGTSPVSGTPGQSQFQIPGMDRQWFIDSLYPLPKEQGGKETVEDFSKSVLPFLQTAAPTALPLGLSTLNQILLGQGKTDPALMNRQLADISRTTQGKQDALTGTLAAQGMSRSGVGAALGGAIGQAGSEQRGQAIAAETQAAEARKRQDLELMLQLLINPALTASGQRLGVPTSNAPSDFESLLGGVTGLIGAF